MSIEDLNPDEKRFYTREEAKGLIKGIVEGHGSILPMEILPPDTFDTSGVPVDQDEQRILYRIIEGGLADN